MSTAAELPTVIQANLKPATEPKRQKQGSANVQPVSHVGDAPEPTQEPTQEPPVTPPPQIQNDVTLTVPMSHVGDGYIPRDVYARGLTSKQSTNLKRLMRGLEDRGAKLENGAPVNDRTKAVKWLLEQLG